MPKTVFDKIWDAHEVADNLLYIDLHLVHEVTSPQAFESLRLAGRGVRRSVQGVCNRVRQVRLSRDEIVRQGLSRLRDHLPGDGQGHGA